MSRLIIILFIPYGPQVSGQLYTNKTRTAVKRELEKQATKISSIAVTVSETDTSLVYSIRDPKLPPADFVYFFDQSGKCILEKTIGYCDSCFNKFLRSALNRKQFQWTRLNKNMYVSKYSKKLILEIPDNNNDHSFIVRRMKWTKDSFRSLLKMN